MKLQSPAFMRKHSIPSLYTCDGKNIHPTLLIADVPEGTKSFALIFDDIHSVKGVWDHWIVWNMPPTTLRINEGELPEGAIEGTTDFGTVGYGGPCPQEGEHTYVFRLYALDILLNLSRGGTRLELERAMEKHLLAQTELSGTYIRAKN